MKTIRAEFLQVSILLSLLAIGFYHRSTASNKDLMLHTQTLLIFEKKPCFGFCPVYKAEFLANGKVLVTYRQREKPEAQISFQLPEKEVKTLWQRGKNLGFFNMSEKFETQKTDFPVRELTMYDKGKSKKISCTEGGSAELEMYLKDLALLVETNLHVNFGPEKK